MSWPRLSSSEPTLRTPCSRSPSALRASRPSAARSLLWQPATASRSTTSHRALLVVTIGSILGAAGSRCHSGAEPVHERQLQAVAPAGERGVGLAPVIAIFQADEQVGRWGVDHIGEHL